MGLLPVPAWLPEGVLLLTCAWALPKLRASFQSCGQKFSHWLGSGHPKGNTYLAECQPLIDQNCL